MALLEDTSNFERLLEVHRSIQDPWATAPYDSITSLLFDCHPDLRQVTVTSLVHLYSHSTPFLDRYAVIQEVLELSKDAATRSMFILRYVVQLLAQHSAHPWTVVLNPWQSHLLQHYERLAPFPTSATSQEEVMEEIWGREWPLVIQLRTRSRHHKIYELATWCLTLGITLTQLTIDLKPHLTDEGIVQMFAVELTRQKYQHLSTKLLHLATSQENTESLDRPKMVELISWGQLGRRYQPPAFLFHRPSHLNRSSAAFDEMFPPSGLRTCDESEYLEREALFVRFGDENDRGSSPELSIMPNSKASASCTIDIKPKIPHQDLIDLSALTPQPTPHSKIQPNMRQPSPIADSEPSSPQRHPKYWSPPPSHSPSPASLEIVKTHGWTALAVIKKEPEMEQKWDSEDEAEEVSRNQHSQSTDDARSGPSEQPGQLDPDASFIPQDIPSHSPPPRSPNLPLGISSSNDGRVAQVDQQPNSASSYPEHEDESSKLPTTLSPTCPLNLQPHSPHSPCSPVASIEPNDGRASSKRPADAMLSGTPEAESAKRVKEAEEPTTPSTGKTRARIPDSPLPRSGVDKLKLDNTVQAQTQEDENNEAEEAKRFERAWTVDSEVWADILRSDSDSEVEDVKPVIPQQVTGNEQVPLGEIDQARGDKERNEGGQQEAPRRERASVVDIVANLFGSKTSTDTDHAKQIVQASTSSELSLPKVSVRSIIENKTADQSHSQAVRGLQRATVAIEVVRRQLTRVHVGSELHLRIGRNEKGNYDVHQDVREETRNLASIRATPEIEADITQFYETIASSLLDYASTLEIGEEISLKITRASFDRYEWSTNVQEIGAIDGGGRRNASGSES
ncbi:hypothetical protein QFC21_005700 [Naganishia friedmannii]|uniref:Uncharacterized protein n=1 Tax=Naganishia friedmannii TaxID=89922 RepID=A0ACC2V7I7_9TREE|nr:hypothetical protein QFC21_005700 [Naganishia friedmannii]